MSSLEVLAYLSTNSLIAPVRQLPRDYHVALASVFTGQLLEMPEAESNRVFACHRAALQPFQTGEEACSGRALHRFPRAPAASSNAVTRASTSSISMAFVA